MQLHTVGDKHNTRLAWFNPGVRPLGTLKLASADLYMLYSKIACFIILIIN
jgi:hypothetical protein